MNVEIRGRPAFAHLAMDIKPGEMVTIESGAMASMSSNTRLRARWNGGFFAAWMRKFFGGESLFVNEVTSSNAKPCQIVLTQPTPGDMHAITLNGTSMFLQSGAYIANSPGVKLGIGWAGISSWIGGEGLFRLRVSGTGTVWIGCYGAITQSELKDPLIVDTNHLVGYEPTVKLKAQLAAGIFSSFFSGEGIVLKLSGPGRVLLQTRSIEGLARWTNGHI